MDVTDVITHEVHRRVERVGDAVKEEWRDEITRLAEVTGEAHVPASWPEGAEFKAQTVLETLNRRSDKPGHVRYRVRVAGPLLKDGEPEPFIKSEWTYQPEVDLEFAPDAVQEALYGPARLAEEVGSL